MSGIMRRNDALSGRLNMADSSTRPTTRDADPNNYRVDQQIGFLLRRAHQYASGVFQERMSEFSLTPPQFSALSMIELQTSQTAGTKAPRPISQSELGRLIDTDRATMQGIVRRLLDRELISVQSDKDDKRKVNLRLTRKGQRILSDATPVAATISTETLDSLSNAEQKQLNALLQKMVRKML